MEFKSTTATKKIIKLSKRIRAVPGGTSASKTISILLYLIAKAQSDKIPTLTSVVSESFPHLRRGAMRDFENIMRGHNYWKDNLWNKSQNTYTFETGSIIEFFSADQHQKLRGGRRDRLFLNECNNIAFQAFEELEVRTKEFVFLDWNPTNEFWYYTEVKDKRTDYEELTITYKDNEALSQQIIDSIEQRKNRKGWWKVYGLGQLGEVEGKIYKDWKIIDSIPHEAILVSRGLDFGFTNDPSVLVDIYKYNGGYIIDEQFYRKGMHNKTIADFIGNLENQDVMTMADSAEPKSIDEIRNYNINIVGVTKGKGSVNAGIDFVQSQRISITKRSVNVIKCYRNYMWMIDKDGVILNKPDHAFSDPMDAIRYGMSPLNRIEEQPDNILSELQFIDKKRFISAKQPSNNKSDDILAEEQFLNSMI